VRSFRSSYVGLALASAVFLDCAPGVYGPWPSTSLEPILALDHPTIETLLDSGAVGAAGSTYRFVAFGDQRALADGEWQEMMARIAELPAAQAPAFLIDTGDIVDDGRHGDQFHTLRDILRPVKHLPYLVGIGNHEVDNNRTRGARVQAAAFLSYLDDELSPDRLYYRKDIGPATFLFLDTNDFTYGENGDRNACPLAIDPNTREGAQLAWLREQAAGLAAKDALVIAVMHHPLVQSSEKHSVAACALWNFSDGGETLADILADAGVDVVLAGHTHTYERFRMVRNDGRTVHLINVSGRPRNAFLWHGSSDRRAQDIRGGEAAWLEELGWLGVDHWEITQEEVMLEKDEADQFALFTVEPDGGLVMEMRFLDEDEPDGTRDGEPVRLR
jgi:hypothetical protein